MNLNQARVSFERERKCAEHEANERKDTYIVLDRLAGLYDSLTASDRSIADRVIEEWLGGDDEGMRFDSMWLIEHFRILPLVPAIRQLADRLNASTAVSAPFERRKALALADLLSKQSTK